MTIRTQNQAETYLRKIFRESNVTHRSVNNFKNIQLQSNKKN